MPEFTFNFKGGVIAQPNVSVKFLLFLINGGKEISFFEAKKIGLVTSGSYTYKSFPSPADYITNCGLVKIFLSERADNQRPLLQSFYLALGSKEPRQEITIHPLNTFAQASRYTFTSDAHFLTSREASTILDENSLSAKLLWSQERLSVDMLRRMITIKRFEAKKEQVSAVHGGVRFLRI
jgi:hypothetical protein